MNISSAVATYLDEVQAIIARMPREPIARVIELLLAASERGATIFTAGNGGSAATASHFAADLAKGTLVAGQPRLRIVPLTDNVPIITAWSNDVAYDVIFAEQVRSLLREGDILILISGSGNSPNVLRAAEEARQLGGITVGFSGFDGGQLAKLVDYPVVIPAHKMRQIEDGHMVLCHLIAAVIHARRLEAVEQTA